MRIISGKWGGRRLVSFQSKAIRPTTDRVKESLFNMIGPDIIGSKVLDLFSGTGNLSFESLSRGAEKVVSVDSGKDSRKLIEKNRALLLDDPKDPSHEYVLQDVLKYIERSQAGSFDYILIDPPFTQKMGAEVIQKLSGSKLFHEDTRIFIEFSSQEKRIANECPPLVLEKEKSYGDKYLCVYSIGS